MNSRVATLCHSTDEVFEQLLDDITARIQEGEVVEVETCVAEHPEYAERLQQLLPAMQVLMTFGRSQLGTVDASASGRIETATGVLGDFRILREIGRGGMGVVYEAEQISIGRPVALKVLPFAAMLDERRLARFRNEIRAAGQLHHTNIVPIYAVGSDRGVHFYAMQLIAGQTLAEVIQEMRHAESGTRNEEPQKSAQSHSALHSPHSAIDTARAALSTLRSGGGAAFFRSAVQLAIQAAEALEHAHASGIVHRDIKPSNLLVDERGTLWLTDFGLAAVDSSGDLTMSGDLLGTLRYMSPEQALGSRVVLDHRTDIYSLGATLYELLTLRPAFDGPDRGELLRQIAVVEPRPPRRVNPAIPADLETIVLKTMSKDASSRYASAQHLADDLRRFLENKPIKARRPSLVEQGRKWTARHATLVAITAGALAVVAAVGGVASFLTLRAYNSEAKQRAVAEANLEVASQLIDRMLTRASSERYWHGDLKQAEQLAADATELYEKLLAHSDDPVLRFRAAKAHGDVAHIWELVGRHEKAGIACRRAGELLLRLTTSYPEQPQYLAALADNYNQIGLVDWSLNRPIAAEPAWRQAWEIWTELAELHPQEPSYQDGVARMLANLGSICYFTDRFEEAEECYRRSEAIAEHLPPELKDSAEGLANQAGSCTNQAELARLRGDYDRALELLAQSIPLHQQSLAKWPTNPVALACYFHTHWNIVECHLGAGRPGKAAAAVERLIATFPNRLSAYHECAAQLLRCAALATGGTPRTPSDGLGESSGDEPRPSPEAQRRATPDASQADSYRRRARELVAKAHEAPDRTPDTVTRFAWFLLMSEDQSFRDPSRALELASSVVKDVANRDEAWFTLALAHYRTCDWQSADDAVQKSIKFSRSGDGIAYNCLLLAMIRAQQGRADEVRQWHEKASDWIADNSQNDASLIRLQAEALAMLKKSAPLTTNATQPDSGP